MKYRPAALTVATLLLILAGAPLAHARWASMNNPAMFYRYRQYAPSMGRFEQRDPIGYEGGMDVYSSVNNRPLVRKDPLGLTDCCCCVKDAGITNIVFGYSGPNLYGHKFNLDISLENVKKSPSTREEQCKLLWKEKSNRPTKDYADAGIKANEWADIYEKFPTALVFKPWKDCLTRQGAGVGPIAPDPISLVDAAMADKALPVRTGYFALTVKSAEGCPCSIISKTVFASQVLEYDVAKDEPKQKTFELGGVPSHP